MSQPNLQEFAKQGDDNTIVSILNRIFASKGVIAKAAIKNDSLHIILEADETPHQQESLTLVREFVSHLNLESLKTVTVYGRQINDEIPDWHETFLLTDVVSGHSINPISVPESSTLDFFTQMISGIGTSIGNTTSQVGKVMVDTATGVGKAASETVFHSGKAMVETAMGVGEAIAGVGGAIGNNAVKTATEVGGNAAKHTYQILSQITQFVAGAPILRKVVDQVDLVKVEDSVRRLQQKHPTETPRQIAQRFITEKAIYAGSTGLVTSLVPGAAIALFAIDLTATSALQAEMVYQIAAAYGLDLRDSARKGEVLTIFGLALGGNQAVKAGLELLQNTPVAGAVIGASTNAVMLYTVGYAACRFYEAKLDSQAMETTLVTSQEASEDYLKTAITQQIIMDQILVHVICAGNPGKSWEDVLPELESLNISPASLSVIKLHLQSPPSLDQLLAQLNRDFAVPLLAQCERIVQRDQVTTPEEAQIIATITQKFEIDWNTMKTELEQVS